MNKIIRVFLSDVKRLSTNVVAVVIIFGLSIIPALYAWFNILSNWDPYGEAATSKMNITVFSEDKGVTYGNLAVNIGDNVISGLKENNSIGWVFSDTKEEALEAVYSGDAYAALLIPEEFTEDMISFISGKPVNPKIEYYENSKKNAIATKITSKVKSTVQQEVNTSFISTLAEVASKSGEMITGESDITSGLFESIRDRIDSTNEDLARYSSLLSSLALVTDSAGGLVDSTQDVLPSLNGIADAGVDTVSGLQSSVNAGSNAASTAGRMVDICLDTVIDGLDNASDNLEKVSYVNDLASVTGSLTVSDAVINQTFVLLKDYMGDTDEYKNAKKSYDTLSADIKKLQTDVSTSQAKLDKITGTLSRDLTNAKTSMKALKATFDYEIIPEINQSIYKVSDVLDEAENLLANVDDNFSDVNATLEAYKKTLSNGTVNINETREYIDTVSEALGKLADEIDELTENEQYQKLVEILKTDPEYLASFIASPVVMNTVAEYEIETYGSAMAPFYTVLALWVGALIVVALVHTHIEDKDEFGGLKNYQAFFGRYITFFLIGQAQTLITVFGVLFYIRIECACPFLFWLACSIISFCFTILIYSLTYALENVGEAIAVVIMVVQVAGAGGTFPVQVLPQIYQDLAGFMPFTYALDALRECVGGLYQLDYVVDLIILGIFILGSIIIGIILEIPFRGLMHMVDHSKEKSGLMI